MRSAPQPAAGNPSRLLLDSWRPGGHRPLRPATTCPRAASTHRRVPGCHPRPCCGPSGRRTSGHHRPSSDPRPWPRPRVWLHGRVHWRAAGHQSGSSAVNAAPSVTWCWSPGRPSVPGIAGVDCVAYAGHPIFGAKAVIRVRRYRDIVGVAGAHRGEIVVRQVRGTGDKGSGMDAGRAAACRSRKLRRDPVNSGSWHWGPRSRRWRC